jgi:hypothetical protein
VFPFALVAVVDPWREKLPSPPEVELECETLPPRSLEKLPEREPPQASAGVARHAMVRMAARMTMDLVFMM